jgi:ATP-dependent Lon protease
MDENTKKLALTYVIRLNNLDKDSSEYHKLNNWINELIKIPFNNYIKLPVSCKSSISNKQQFLLNTKKCLDDAVYGHNNAKQHILQVISKWITNDKSGGNILALQGPMGNGKTTLVKDGISKSINRPFTFIALGGTSDVSYFNGHGYTYEGSKCGKIVDILKSSKCMNPIIYFDELDKVSDTYRGQEIIHMLTHLTDSTQNSLFVDNYFHGVTFDLSKVLFIFSFNDETKIDKILKDRMYVINTSGYKIDDKIKIAENYLLPKLLDTYKLHDKVNFSTDIFKYIIDNYTYNEEGVRNLNRCLETIISKFNLYLILNSENSLVKLDFKLNNFKIPHIFSIENIETLLNKKNIIDKPPEHMYM